MEAGCGISVCVLGSLLHAMLAIGMLLRGADLTQELLYWLKCLKQGVFWRWEPWNIRPVWTQAYVIAFLCWKGNQVCKSTSSCTEWWVWSQECPLRCPAEKEARQFRPKVSLLMRPCPLKGPLPLWEHCDTSGGEKTPNSTCWVIGAHACSCLARSQCWPCPVTCGGAAKPSSLSMESLDPGLSLWS